MEGGVMAACYVCCNHWATFRCSTANRMQQW